VNEWTAARNESSLLSRPLQSAFHFRAGVMVLFAQEECRGGWDLLALRQLLGLRVLVYVHKSVCLGVWTPDLGSLRLAKVLSSAVQ